MNITFEMITFNGNYILDAVLETIYPYAHRIVIVEGPVGYYVAQGHRHSTDGTIELVQNFPDPHDKIRLVSGQWSEKDEMVNAALPHIPADTQFIWHVDDDECHYPGVIEETIRVLETGRWDSISFRSLCFYGGFERIWDEDSYEQGFEFHRVQRWQAGSRWATHRPPTILAIGDGRPWREHSHLAFFAGMPHYSYVWPSRVKSKAEYIENSLAPGRCIPDYFNQVFVPWIRGNDAERQAIEDRFNGTHEIPPDVRGPCRTGSFNRPHPPAIEKRLPQLRQRLETELGRY